MRPSRRSGPSMALGAGRSTACSMGSRHCWPICAAPGCGWPWPPPSWSRRRILTHFGLDQHFEVIAGACPDGSRKSKEEVLGHALAQLRPLPERVLMVGDRSHDVDGAAAHGIDTVVVGWGYGQADFADGFAVTGVTHAATIAELRRALGV
jgi:phosphoglycolate phosphatase-like HAD superfamily hydrolase